MPDYVYVAPVDSEGNFPDTVRARIAASTELTDAVDLMIQEAIEAIPAPETSTSNGRSVFYDGTNWPDRLAGDDPVMAIATKFPGAPRPTWLVIGDMLIQHPDDLDAL